MMRQTLATALNLLVNAGLVYILIGTLLYVFLDGAGIIGIPSAMRIANGRAHPTIVLALCAVWMIVGWPRFAKRLLRGSR